MPPSRQMSALPTQVFTSSNYGCAAPYTGDALPNAPTLVISSCTLPNQGKSKQPSRPKLARWLQSVATRVHCCMGVLALRAGGPSHVLSCHTTPTHPPPSPTCPCWCDTSVKVPRLQEYLLHTAQCIHRAWRTAGRDPGVDNFCPGPSVWRLGGLARVGWGC